MATMDTRLSHLLPPHYADLISSWLREDCPNFDYGGFVVGDGNAEANLIAKSGGILAGIPFVDEVFRQLNCDLTWHVSEGCRIPGEAKTHVATVHGAVRNILLGERVALNILARSSGIATRSADLLALTRLAGYGNILSGTRKTTPGFRQVEKYAMLVGGCDPHRMDLSSMTMLKDNHIVAAGSIQKAVHAAKAVGGFAIKVEVECQSEAEADEAIAAGADVVMLDNFSGGQVKAAASRLKGRWKGKQQFLLEVSGGLTKENVEDFICDDVDIISTSSIHQGVAHLDFSLKLVKGLTAPA